MLKKLLALSLFVVAAFTLSACNRQEEENPEDLLAEAVANLNIPTETSTDLDLPTTSDNDITMSWESSNTDFIQNDGSVIRPTITQGDQDVDLTATLSLGDNQLTETFTVTVLANPDYTDSELISLIEENLSIEGDLTSVTTDLTLTTSMYDVDIVWTSSNTDVIEADGSVTRPANNNETVTITANFTAGSEEGTLDFEVTVLKSDVVHTIDYQFINATDADLFNLGDVQNMHDVSDGALTLTHTGVTDYPSKGSRIHISTNQYPYLAFYVNDLVGSNAKWAVKVHINDSYEDFTLIADTTNVGLVYADLRDIDVMPIEDDVKLDMYIYILGGEGSSVSFDFISSTDTVPETLVFDDETKVSNDGGTVALENERLQFESQDSTSTVSFDLYTALDVAPMLDVFMLSVAEGTIWSLEVDGITLIDNATRNGAFSINLVDAGLTQGGNLTYTITYQGEFVMDSIANESYVYQTETFEYETIDALLGVWKETGAARLDLDIGNDNTVRLSQALPEGNTITTRRFTTNLGSYPKFYIDVDALSTDVALHVKVDGVTVISDITEAGEYTVNLIDYYMRGLKTVTVELQLTYSGTEEFNASNPRFVDIDSIDFQKDATMSTNALPPKGDSVTAEGGVQEYGYNDNNWSSNARTIARDGQIIIVNTDWFSKAEVFAQNIDILTNPYINIKVDDITSDTTWKLDIIINPNADNITITLMPETNALGTYSFDLREYTDLENINLLSYSLYIVGGVNKTVTLDYLEHTDVATGSLIGEGDNFTEINDWVLQDNMSFTAESDQGTVTLNSGGYGKVSKTFTVNTTETPYLYIDIVSSGGTWKLDPSLITESGNTGEFYVDLTPMGTGIITITVDLFVVGADGTELVINEIAFVEEDPTVVIPEIPEIFDGFTPALDVSAEYTNDQYVITLNSGGYGKMEKEFTVDLDATPYLYLNIASSGGTWKLDPSLIAESSDTGEFYVDLTTFGTGTQTFTLDIFVVGGDGAQLVIDDMAFVASIPEGTPEIFDGFTPALDVSAEYTNDQYVITLNSGGYGKMEKEFTVDLDATPYLYLNITSSGGTWKLDPSLIAESSDTGEFYVDLTTFGTGTQTFTLDIFVIGGDGAQLVIDDMAFVASIPEGTPEIFDGFTPALDVSAEYTNDQYVITLNSGGYGKMEKEFTVDLDATPYLYLNIASSGGTWKLDPSLIAESSDTGEFYVDLTTFGTGTQTFTLDIFVIGGDGAQLVIDDMAFVASIPEGTPEIFDGFTPALDVSAEYTNDQYVITLNSGGYGKMEKEFTVDLDATPYLYLNIASSGGTWKLDPSLIAESSDTGEFYVDLTTFGTGTQTFTLDIFVVGGDGVQLVIDDMAFVASIPAS